MLPSIRSRRVVSNGGLRLSVAYDLTCLMTSFCLYKLCLKMMNEAVDGAINLISSSNFEWWHSFLCSLRCDMFHEGFRLG